MHCQCQHRIETDTKIIKEMSLEHCYQYAEETPIIPDKEMKDSLANHSGYGSNIQKYCNTISVQSDVRMQSEGLPDIVPTQQQARKNSAHWQDELNPQIIKISTNVRSFCTYYGSLTESDIESLVNDVGTPSGNEMMKILLNEFSAEGQRHNQDAKKTGNDLNVFHRELDSDLRNFTQIKLDIDSKVGGTNGRIKLIESDLSDLKTLISTLDKLISAMAITLGTGFVGIIAGVLLALVTAGGGIALVTGGIIATVTGSVLLNQYRKEREEATVKQKNLSEELKTLTQLCTVLQLLNDEFVALSNDNQKASAESDAMARTWQVLESNFKALNDRIDQIKDIEDLKKFKVILKLRLKAALKSTADIGELAKKNQENGTLPIVPDGNLIRLWNFPREWYKQPIDPRVIREHVDAQRKLQRFRRYEYAEKGYFCP